MFHGRAGGRVRLPQQRRELLHRRPRRGLDHGDGRAGPGRDRHLAPLWSDLSTAGGGREVEAAGDLVETDLVDLGMRYDPGRRTISDHTSRMLQELHDTIMACLRDAVRAVQEGDIDLARKGVKSKPVIQDLVGRGEQALASRLDADDPNSLKLYALEISVIEKLRRIYYFAKRICRYADAVVDSETPGAEQEQAAGAAAE